MTNNDGEQPAGELVAVTVRGSRQTHYMINGRFLTLCARIAEYRWRYQPRDQYCRRCVSEATRHGFTIRP